MATRQLMVRADLDEAFMTATPAGQLFSENLIAAASHLRIAALNVVDFDPVEQPELVSFAHNCLKRSRLIAETVERAAKADAEGNGEGEEVDAP